MIHLTNMILLGMLMERPMHGYELQQQIQSRRLDVWAHILSGSIYYALNKMEKEGLVRTESEERTGARLRKIYAVTEQGRETFKELLQAAVLQPPHETGSAFFTILPWLSILDSRDAFSFLMQNKKRLEDARLLWETRRAELAAQGGEDAQLWAVENTMEIIDADLRFLQRLLASMA